MYNELKKVWLIWYMFVKCVVIGLKVVYEYNYSEM